MRTISAAELCAAINAVDLGNGPVRCELHGDPQTILGPDVVRDNRHATPGSIFVALPGERVDGHDFAKAAADAGAAAILATRLTDAPCVHLIVDDSVVGLSALASAIVRREKQAGLTTFAITGSSGKTSTKDLLSQILAADGKTVSPVGSYNNEIGVPLTASQVDEDTKYLVSEMGARGIGHVAWLCRIVPPTISTVINVGTAHLGEFGSREAIAQAKGEIVEALDADGWAVLNADNDLTPTMASRTKAHVAWFSTDATRPSDAQLPEGELVVVARDLVADDLDRYSFALEVTRDQQTARHPVVLKLSGLTQAIDATAAATAAIAAGIEPAQVADALSNAVVRSPWRMEVHELPNGAALINDAYNANPDSMRAALESVAAMGVKRRAHEPNAKLIAVLGDMLELGDDADELHRQIGEHAVELGFDDVYAIGDFAEQLAAGAGNRGHVVEAPTLPGQLQLGPGDVVVVKASRGLSLEKVADAIIAAAADSQNTGEDKQA